MSPPVLAILFVFPFNSFLSSIAFLLESVIRLSFFLFFYVFQQYAYVPQPWFMICLMRLHSIITTLSPVSTAWNLF